MHTRRDAADDDSSAEEPAVWQCLAAAVFHASCFSAHQTAGKYIRYSGTAPPSDGHRPGKHRVPDDDCRFHVFRLTCSDFSPYAAGFRLAGPCPARHVPACIRVTRPTGRKSGISPRLTIRDTFCFSSCSPDRFHHIQSNPAEPEKNRFFCNKLQQNSVSPAKVDINGRSRARCRSAPPSRLRPPAAFFSCIISTNISSTTSTISAKETNCLRHCTKNRGVHRYLPGRNALPPIRGPFHPVCRHNG